MDHLVAERDAGVSERIVSGQQLVKIPKLLDRLVTSYPIVVGFPSDYVFLVFGEAV